VTCYHSAHMRVIHLRNQQPLRPAIRYLNLTTYHKGDILLLARPAKRSKSRLKPSRVANSLQRLILNGVPRSMLCRSAPTSHSFCGRFTSPVQPLGTPSRPHAAVRATRRICSRRLDNGQASARFTGLARSGFRSHERQNCSLFCHPLRPNCGFRLLR